jgi:hypothetical protein
MDFLFELYQQRQISAAAESASQANTRATDSQYAIRHLEECIDKLVLINTAMWELLKSRTGLTEEDLRRQMEIVDLRDGVADGKVTRVATGQCPHCHRPMSPRHSRCLYCGKRDPNAKPFETVR